MIDTIIQLASAIIGAAISGYVTIKVAKINKQLETPAVFLPLGVTIPKRSNLPTEWIIIIAAVFTLVGGGIGYLITAFLNWNLATLSIEAADVISLPYEGRDYQKAGEGYLAVTSSAHNGNLTTIYDFAYVLPDNNNEAYAGFNLDFREPLDISAYNYLEFKISFSDEQARCTLYLDDKFNGSSSVILGDGSIVLAKSDEQIVKIPLSKFISISRKFISEITIEVKGYLTQGRHSFKISEVKFTK